MEFDHQVRSEIALHVCPALMHLWKATGEYSYADVALDQMEKMHSILFDEKSGLWYHGASERYFTAAFWSRGAAFALMAFLQTLEPCERSDARFEKLLSVFQSMATRLRELQNEDGFWFQIVDDPRGENESSGTAWNCWTFERAMSLGFLDDSFRPACDAAWNAVKTRVFDGHFPGNATGTTSSPIYNYFSQRQLSPTGWTHFAFLAACERRRTI
jgi:unsaturated rhamnogalacturonyl hydrolase